MDTSVTNGNAVPAKPLKVALAGSVDDGKSTLTGRLLFDTELLPDDQMHAMLKAGNGIDGEPDLASLTDGLTDEQEQGITIDVAHRYIDLAGRRIVLADVPGHEQYTRNMVTGASDADVVIILIDPKRGTTEQTWRHLFLALLLGVRDVIVAVNKMDAIGYDKKRFLDIETAVKRYAAGFPNSRVRLLPVSALRGDNVVSASISMPWYTGPTLLSLLSELDNRPNLEDLPFRLAVSYVARPGPETDRAYLGQIQRGRVAVGDWIRVMPSGRPSSVRAIQALGQPVEEAKAGQSVALYFNQDIDIARGDILAQFDRVPAVLSKSEGLLFWFSPRPMASNGLFILRQNTKSVRTRVTLSGKLIDVLGPGLIEDDVAISENVIATAHFQFQSPLACDLETHAPSAASFLLIDEDTNETVAGGILGPIDSRV